MLPITYSQIPIKYPPRPKRTYAPLENEDDGYRYEDMARYSTGNVRQLFNAGSAYAHALYMVQMSFKHPILYFLWYRWWIPSLLHDSERKHVSLCVREFRKGEYRPYWAEFSLYHPFQFILWLFLFRLFSFLKNRFSGVRKDRDHSN